MHTEEKRQRKLSKGLHSSAPTPPYTPGHATPPAAIVDAEVMVDAERGQVITYERDWRYLGFRRRPVREETQIKPSFRDINPLPVMATIFAKPTNAIVLLSSSMSPSLCFFLTRLRYRVTLTHLAGILFAAQYTVTYTAAITLAA